MNKSIELVIPLGPSGINYNMPNIEYLIFGLEKLKNSIVPVFITFAIDENLQPNRLEIVKKYADKIKVFPKHSYFRPGGIWNKIYTCWEESDSKYVCWNGYDDFSDENRFFYQYNALEKSVANSCFCSNYLYKENKELKINDGNINFLSELGRHPLYMGGFLLRKDAILNSGIKNYREKWAYYFEGLLYTHIIKTGIPINAKNAKFYYREHYGTISETVKEKEDWVKKITEEVGYSFTDCKNDWDSVNFEQLCEETRRFYR